MVPHSSDRPFAQGAAVRNSLFVRRRYKEVVDHEVGPVDLNQVALGVAGFGLLAQNVDLALRDLSRSISVCADQLVGPEDVDREPGQCAR